MVEEIIPQVKEMNMEEAREEIWKAIEKQSLYRIKIKNLKTNEIIP